MTRGFLAALGLAGLALALRVGGARHFWLNGDEGIYYWVAHAGSLAVVSGEIGHNVHPPLFYLLLRLAALAGEDPLWLRLPSLVAGSLAVAAAFALARELGGALAGCVAALLLAFSPGAIALSQVARPYALQLLVLLLALFALARYTDGKRRGALPAYAALLLVAVLLHYSSFFVAGAALATLTWARLSGRLAAREWRALALAHAPAALAMTALLALHAWPSVLASGFRADAAAGWLSPFFPRGPGDAWRALLGVLEYLAGPELAAPLLLLLLFSLALACARGAWLLAGLGGSLLTLALLAALLRLYPLGCTRHAAWLAALIAPALGYGAGQLARLRGRRAAAGFALLAALALLQAPLARALGLREDRVRAQPELFLPRRAVTGWLVPRLRQLGQQPGLLVMDQITAYTLMPLFLAAQEEGAYRRPDELRSFAWGQRQAFVAPSFFMVASASQRGEPNHLASVLARIRAERPELAAALAGDVRVLSANGTHLYQALRGRRLRDLVDAVEVEAGALCLFRLRAADYLERASSSRGSAPSGAAGAKAPASASRS